MNKELLLIDIQYNFLMTGDKNDISYSLNILNNIIENISKNNINSIHLVCDQTEIIKNKYNAKYKLDLYNFYIENFTKINKLDEPTAIKLYTKYKELALQKIPAELILLIEKNKIKYSLIKKQQGQIRHLIDNYLEVSPYFLKLLDNKSNNNSISNISQIIQNKFGFDKLFINNIIFNNSFDIKKINKEYKKILKLNFNEIEIMGGAMLECVAEEMIKLKFLFNEQNKKIDFILNENFLYGKYDENTFSILNKESKLFDEKLQETNFKPKIKNSFFKRLN